MKRAAVAPMVAIALFMQATAGLAAGGNGNGPRYNCTSPGGSYYEGATPGTAKKLERAGYVCVRAN